MLLQIAAATASDTTAVDPRQAQVKSAFVLNIARFVYWPSGTFADGDPFDLCMLRENPYGKAIEALKKRTISDRRIAIHIVEELPEENACHLLFIPTSQLDTLPRDFDLPRLLTISDLSANQELESHLGSTIVSLLREDSRVAIAIDRGRGEDNGLKFSSELLKLSRPIKRQNTDSAMESDDSADP